MKYDVFVSYRRTSFESANLIAEKLRSMGFSVFFDVETLRSGNFNEQLYNVIDNCNDFVLVLPPNALDNCNNEADWVRKETIRAISKNKNIIPVMLSGFEYPSPMPSGMEQLSQYQSIKAGEQEFFDMSMHRLAGYLKSKPHRDMRKFYKKSLIVVLVALVLTFMGFVSIRQFAKPLYKNVATNVTSGMSAIDNLYGELNSLIQTWEDFIDAYESTLNDGQRERILSDYIRTITSESDELDFLYSQFIRLPELTSSQARLLGVNDIQSHEVEAFYSIFDILYYEIKNQYNYILSTVSNPDVLKEATLRAHNTIYVVSSAKMTQAMIDNVFYSYLELMSKFPKFAHEQYNIQCPMWKNLPPTLGLNLTIEQYRVYQEVAGQKAESIMAQMEMDVARLKGEVAVEKQMLQNN